MVLTFFVRRKIVPKERGVLDKELFKIKLSFLFMERIMFSLSGIGDFRVIGEIGLIIVPEVGSRG